MFPISDDNPRNIIPFVSWTLLGLCVAAFLWQIMLDQQSLQTAIYEYGMVPARLFGAADIPGVGEQFPPWATILTSMFLHGDILHLAGNMLFLWIFGDNIEESMGHLKFLVFYILCGIVAALLQAGLNPESPIPMIGASGAISGVLGAYILLHPFATVRVLFILGVYANIVKIPAVLVLGLWFAGQVASAAFTPLDQPGIAFWAHIGGFVAGLILVIVFRRRDVPLFQRALSKPFSKEKEFRYRSR